MKSHLILILILTSFFCSFSQEKKPDELIKFKQKEKDFGKIKQGKPVSFEFVFDNISNEDVVIEEVLPPCSCTIVSKPEGKVAKGKSNRINVEYNSISTGVFDRKIRVKLAGITKFIYVRITGEVLDGQTFDEYVKTQN
jgi:hypothetical protein